MAFLKIYDWIRHSLQYLGWPFALLAFSLAAHFTGYLTYPPGVGGDAARLGITTLDFLQRGLWPFYIYHVYAPNFLVIYLQAPLFAAFGFSPALLRGLTTFAGALASPLAYILCRELLAEHDTGLARRAGILAGVGLALSPFFQVFSRQGAENMLLPMLALLTTACLWRALRRGQKRDFVLAGLVLGLSQYSYIVARGFALALAGACLVALLADRRLFARWRGLVVMGVTALVIMLPQLILFVTAPPTFTARTQQAAGQFVFGLANPIQTLGLKLLNQLAALGWQWETGYHPFSTRPLLHPVFFGGFILAVVMALRSRRAAYLFGLALTALMLLPDLLTYEGLSPSATRISSAVPFIFIVGATGCAIAWQWLDRYRAKRAGLGWPPIGSIGGWLAPALVLIASAESQWNFRQSVIPAALAAEGLEWKASLVETAEADYLNAHADQAILIPSSEYQRAPLTFLLIDRFPERASGLVPPLTPGETVTVILPVAPDRPTTDGPPANYIPDEWVLLKNGSAYFMPPLPGGLNAFGDVQPLFAGNGAAAAQVFSARWAGVYPVVETTSASFVNGLSLVGYQATALMPGQPVTVTLYWQRRAPLPADVQLFIQILNREGNAVAAIHDWPLHGAYRAAAWRPNEIMPLSYTLTIPADAPPGPYRLAAGVYDILQQKRAPLTTGEDVATVATLKIPLLAANTQPAQSIAADFGPAIHLAGYTLAAAPDGVTLSLFWQAVAAADFDYTVFLHFVDAEGKIVAQADAQPLNGQYPTSIWSPGETIVDDRMLSVSPGRYQLFIGLYRWDTGERLPASVNGERAADDRVLLGEIEVR